MNIWILNHYGNTPDLPGGTRHFDLASGLVDMGHDVTIFASAFNHKLRQKVHLSEENPWGVEYVDGVRFVWIDTFPYKGNNWRRFVNMVSYMVRVSIVGRKLPRRLPEIPVPEVIIGSSVHLLAVIAAYFLTGCFKAHFVMEVRDLWPQTLVDMGRLPEKGILTRSLHWLERFLYKQAELIIVLLPKAGEYIVNTGIEQTKVCWIPNGVSLSPLSNPSEANPLTDVFTVMYVGAHGEANGLNTLLLAAKLIQDKGIEARFVLVGDGPEKGRLMALSKDLGLTNTEFWDAVPKSAVQEILEQSDALIFILKDIDVFKYGISSNKLFDYLAASKPIVFSCNAENNIVQQSGSGISVPAENAELLADAIIQVYEMPTEERLAMGVRGRKYVEKYYDTKVLAGRLENIMQELGPNERQKNTEDVQTTF